MKMQRIFIALICVLFGFLWLYAGLQKLGDLPNFRNQMSKSPMLTGIAPILAYAVPLVELALVYMLIYKRTRLFALYASLFLMVQFITYLFLILNYSFYVPCACGGIISGMSWHVHILFNTGFVVLAVMGIAMETKRRYAPLLKEGELDHLTIRYT
ncbi:MauE/DoxX family redox-associated membrane protein [Pedobacter sp.]